MNRHGPGFTVLYRWKLHPGSEAAFVEAWSRVSELLHTQRGSLGARLHVGSDGLWYSYAQWPDAATRSRSLALGPVDPDASEKMRTAIAETLPEIVLEPRADFLFLPNDPGIQSFS